MSISLVDFALLNSEQMNGLRQRGGGHHLALNLGLTIKSPLLLLSDVSQPRTLIFGVSDSMVSIRPGGRSGIHLIWFLRRTLYQRFELRPHGILEVLAGDVPFCFPTVLPRYVNVGILSRFLTPLIPTGASELHLRMTMNGDLLYKP